MTILSFLPILSLLLAIGNGQVNVVHVQWNNVTIVSKTALTLQVVVNPYVLRGSPIHDGTFAALQNLQADYVRFVPWLPYPRLGVAELKPPTGNPICASVVNDQTLFLACYEGIITSIQFASYGTPGGRCGNFSTSDCHASTSAIVVEKYCLGKANCTVNATDIVFGDPCFYYVKRLAVQAVCSTSVNRTFWNFTLLDPLMEDFMGATKNHSVIINFSTTPQWMWNTPAPIDIPDDPTQVFWSYEQGNDLRDSSMQDLGNYYKRLVGWYTNGGFYDEYDQFHKSPWNYNIPMWEVLNEVESEHGMNPEYYTAIYDAIVTAILEVQPNMEFVGLALEGREPEWVAYFCNISNHANSKIPLDWISYHFYVGPNMRTNVTQYQDFFPQADSFFVEVEALQAAREANAPWVKTTIDEIGCILPDDNAVDPFPATIPDLYWNACGGMFAYVFGNLVMQGIEVLGESQLVGYPSQYPSVSLMDWTNAQPNNRYWILFMLHSNFHVGDKVVLTTFSNNITLFAQGFATPTGNKILLINKVMTPIEVMIANMPNGGTMQFVDESTYDNPPATIELITNTFTLSPFAVAIVTVS